MGAGRGEAWTRQMQIRSKKRSRCCYPDGAKQKDKALETQDLCHAGGCNSKKRPCSHYVSFLGLKRAPKEKTRFRVPPGRSRTRVHRRRYLHAGLGELGPLSQLLPGVNVGVVGSLKSALQFLQLLCREGGSASALFPLQGQVWFRVNVRAFIRLGCRGWGYRRRKGMEGEPKSMTDPTLRWVRTDTSPSGQYCVFKWHLVSSGSLSASPPGRSNHSLHLSS